MFSPEDSWRASGRRGWRRDTVMMPRTQRRPKRTRDGLTFEGCGTVHPPSARELNGRPSQRGSDGWRRSWQERAAGPDAHDTRGKTAPQRLRRLDQFLMALEPGLLSAVELHSC